MYDAKYLFSLLVGGRNRMEGQKATRYRTFKKIKEKPMLA